MSDLRLRAIRNMYNGTEGDHIRLGSGETIYSWVMLDDGGALVDLLELDDIEIVEAYNENTIWMEPEYEKIG
jgi:NAD dependent epimerase/dehydratase family enzyme